MSNPSAVGEKKHAKKRKIKELTLKSSADVAMADSNKRPFADEDAEQRIAKNRRKALRKVENLVRQEIKTFNDPKRAAKGLIKGEAVVVWTPSNKRSGFTICFLHEDLAALVLDPAYSYVHPDGFSLAVHTYINSGLGENTNTQVPERTRCESCANAITKAIARDEMRTGCDCMSNEKACLKCASAMLAKVQTITNATHLSCARCTKRIYYGQEIRASLSFGADRIRSAQLFPTGTIIRVGLIAKTWKAKGGYQESVGLELCSISKSYTNVAKAMAQLPVPSLEAMAPILVPANHLGITDNELYKRSTFMQYLRLQPSFGDVADKMAETTHGAHTVAVITKTNVDEIVIAAKDQYLGGLSFPFIMAFYLWDHEKNESFLNLLFVVHYNPRLQCSIGFGSNDVVDKSVTVSERLNSAARFLAVYGPKLDWRVFANLGVANTKSDLATQYSEMLYQVSSAFDTGTSLSVVANVIVGFQKILEEYGIPLLSDYVESHSICETSSPLIRMEAADCECYNLTFTSNDALQRPHLLYYLPERPLKPQIYEELAAYVTQPQNQVRFIFCEEITLGVSEVLWCV